MKRSFPLPLGEWSRLPGQHQEHVQSEVEPGGKKVAKAGGFSHNFSPQKPSSQKKSQEQEAPLIPEDFPPRSAKAAQRCLYEAERTHLEY